MTGTVEDVAIAQQHFGAEDFKQALRNAPAGVIDARSWTYWHTVLGIEPVPSLPRRPFLDDIPEEQLYSLWPFR